MPVVGYGLYQIPAEESEGATLEALRIGYRHLDSAAFYANEEGVGRAIAASGLPRDELFVASKVWTDCVGLGAACVRSSIEKSLALLQLDYLDLAYVHWPVPGKHVEAYRAIEELVREGKVRAIGLSNYRIEDYQELMAAPGRKVEPAVNQIEVNPFLYRAETIAYFQTREIPVVAYKPFLRGKGTEEALVVSLAEKYSTTPGEVLLRWGFHKGLVLFPKSVRSERMALNLACASPAHPVKLADQDVAALDALTDAGSEATFQAHFAKRAVADATNPTIALGYGALGGAADS